MGLVDVREHSRETTDCYLPSLKSCFAVSIFLLRSLHGRSRSFGFLVMCYFVRYIRMITGFGNTLDDNLVDSLFLNQPCTEFFPLLDNIHNSTLLFSIQI